MIDCFKNVFLVVPEGEKKDLWMRMILNYKNETMIMKQKPNSTKDESKMFSN